MDAWPVQDAEARFSEMLDKCLREGPQSITRLGVKAAVLVSAEDWDSLAAQRQPDFKSWLTADLGRGDLSLPRRGGAVRRSSGGWSK